MVGNPKAIGRLAKTRVPAKMPEQGDFKRNVLKTPLLVSYFFG